MLAASAALVEPDPSPAVDLPDSPPAVDQPGSSPAAAPSDPPPVIIEPPTESIVIAGQDAPSPLRRQVRAELGVLGLELVDIPGSDLSGVVCGLVIDLPKREARVVVQSARSDQIFTRTIALPRLDNDSNVRVAALQIVDILQTMRAEAHRPSPHASTNPEPESEPIPTPAPEPEPAPPPPSRALALWASGGVQWNSGGLTPGAHVDAGFAWSVRPWLAPALVSSWPVTARQRQSPEGRVRVWPLSLAAGPRFGVGDPSAVVRFEVLPALGVVLNLLRGEAQAPYTGQRRRSLGLSAQLRPGMSIRLGASLRLRVDALVGGQWPRVAIGVVSREEGAMDPLVLGGSVGLQIHPPLRARGRSP